MAGRWRWNIPTFEEIRRSPSMKATLYKGASSIASAAGEGYEVRVTEGKSRSRAAVLPVTLHAMRSNAKHNTLFHAASRGGR